MKKAVEEEAKKVKDHYADIANTRKDDLKKFQDANAWLQPMAQSISKNSAEVNAKNFDTHKDYYEKMKQQSDLITQTLVCKNYEAYDLDKCVNQVKMNMGVGQVIEKADKARTELLKSQVENSPLTPDQKKNTFFPCWPPA